MKKKANPNLTIGGFLPTLYQPNTKHSKEVMTELKASFGSQVFEVCIEKTVKFPDSVVVTEEEYNQPPYARSILRFDSQSKYAEAYRKLARKVMQ